jgi:hypothetical protein
VDTQGSSYTEFVDLAPMSGSSGAVEPTLCEVTDGPPKASEP